MPLENARLVAALLIALVALGGLGVWAHLEWGRHETPRPDWQEDGSDEEKFSPDSQFGVAAVLGASRRGAGGTSG